MDKRQKVQESDEIGQNLANKVTNSEGLMKLGDCQWIVNGVILVSEGTDELSRSDNLRGR